VAAYLEGGGVAKAVPLLPFAVGRRGRATGIKCPRYYQPAEEGTTMATFITTIHFTEQGIKAVRDTCKRAEAFKATAQKMGVKVTGLYWTLGAFDGVIVCEAPDEETATTALLHLGSLGNLRTQTARAYDATEMQRILGRLTK
jgi:uncharacterized protein with GYD domain